jgi:hypothetical protein
MAENGFPPAGGPIAAMLHEHELGRSLVRALGELAAQKTPWSVADRGRIAGFAHRYAELLRLHIQKEDNVLFPMADARLPGTAMEQVGKRFEKFEAEETGRGEHERFHALAEELISAYAPRRAGAPACEHLLQADLVICADCVPFTVPNFRARYSNDIAVGVGCPKLDDLGHYAEKLETMLQQAQPRRLTVVCMEVPCCAGMSQVALQAASRPGMNFPVEEHVAGIRGGIMRRVVRQQVAAERA